MSLYLGQGRLESPVGYIEAVVEQGELMLGQAEDLGRLEGLALAGVAWRLAPDFVDLRGRAR